MELVIETQKVYTNSFDEEDRSFPIGIDSDSPHMFEALTKMLYPNPVVAIAREITANALDANREVGNAHVPVQIWMPGEFLSIRDSGPGMSPERVREVFGMMGRSTKRNDDTQRGCFGLGSKSPFAYKGIFYVTTVVDGICYVYEIYKDAEFKPRINTTDEFPTDEPNGTEVRIPVDEYDVWKFRNALRLYTKFWDVQPIFHGYNPEPAERPTLDTPRWSIYTKPIGANILLDGVPYTDNVFKIPNRVVLKFGIGELDTILNRDNLRYSDKTNNGIQEALASYNKEVLEEVHKQISTIETFSDVIQVIESLPQAHTQREYTWDGKTFKYPLEQEVLAFERPRDKTRSMRTKLFDADNLIDECFVVLDSKTLMDLTSYDRARITSLINTNDKVKTVYLLEANHTLPVKATPLSTMKVHRNPTGSGRGGGSRGPRMAKAYVKGRTYDYKRLNSYPITPNDEIAYVTSGIDRYNYMRNFPVTVVEISEKEEKYILNEPNWIQLDEYLKNELYDKISETEIQAIADHQKAVGEYSKFNFLANKHDDFKFLDSTEIVNKYPEKIRMLVTWLVSNRKITQNPVDDLYKKYPMLGHLGYFYGDKETEKDILDYINLLNPTT